MSQWQQEEAILAKVRQLSEKNRLQLESYLDSLVEKDTVQADNTRMSA